MEVKLGFYTSPKQMLMKNKKDEMFGFRKIKEVKKRMEEKDK